jgi:hypothetical protein
MAHWAKIMCNKTATLQTIIFAGSVAGNIVSWEQSGGRMVGYWLGREYWGKGMASAALLQFLSRVTTRPLVACVIISRASSGREARGGRGNRISRRAAIRRRRSCGACRGMARTLRQQT